MMLKRERINGNAHDGRSGIDVAENAADYALQPYSGFSAMASM